MFETELASRITGVSTMVLVCAYVQLAKQSQHLASQERVIALRVKRFPPRVRVAGSAVDPGIASQRDPLIARVTVGEQFPLELAGDQEFVWSVAVAADGEIEDIQRQS